MSLQHPERLDTDYGPDGMHNLPGRAE